MFYKILNGDTNNKNAKSTPDENESNEFWKKEVLIKDAEWLSSIKSGLLNLDHEEDIVTYKKDLRKMIQKHLHWKVPGKDGLQGYWTKAFKSLHDQLYIS